MYYLIPIYENKFVYVDDSESDIITKRGTLYQILYYYKTIDEKL